MNSKKGCYSVLKFLVNGNKFSVFDLATALLLVQCSTDISETVQQTVAWVVVAKKILNRKIYETLATTIILGDLERKLLEQNMCLITCCLIFI